MSYNIDNWKTKTINKLTIPMRYFYNREISYEIKLRADGVIITGDSEGFRIHGNIVDDDIVVDDIRDYGEGSGYGHERLIEMLRESKGDLEAVLIWEHGDSITRLLLHDGIITEEEIEL